jgi:hypothetical protein
MNRGILLAFLVFLVASLPYDDQMTLANSLIVGRDDASDLFSWTCKVCDASNKPVHAHIIEEKAVDIKCIVSVYSNFVVLAFRYTNTALNVWQDILYPLQVTPNKFRSKMNIPVPTAKSKKHTITCGKKSNLMSLRI